MSGNEQKFYETVCKPNFDELKEDVREILTSLKGNGNVGLCEKVRNHNDRIAAVEEEHETAKQYFWRTIRWVAGIVGGSWLLAKSPEIIAWIKNIL